MGMAEDPCRESSAQILIPEMVSLSPFKESFREQDTLSPSILRRALRRPALQQQKLCFFPALFFFTVPLEKHFLSFFT